AGYIEYFPGEPLRKVAHRSVCVSKTVVPLRRRRAVARKSSPPRKLTLKNKPTARWSSNYCYCNNNQCCDSDSEVSSTGSCSSFCSSAGTHPSLIFE
ncbi:hypothetical protein KSS87_023508, partial [Heliosperma pusillum]